MATRCVLITIMFFQLMIAMCFAVNGIIWCKKRQKFVQLFSIPHFAALQEEHLAKYRATEMRDMKHEIIKVVFYEEKNMVTFLNNNTKITGICGELWYLLADYLNFTLIPMRTIFRNFGKKLQNGKANGLVGILERNEAQVILRSEFSSSRMNDVDYTMPVWKSKFQLYVGPIWQYNNDWIFTLFSLQTGCCIIFLFIVMSLLGYFLQKMQKDLIIEWFTRNSENFSLSDHFFHSFAMMCSQGYIPDAFYNKFKILSFSKSIFVWLVTSVFNSNLIYRMTNRESILPFTNMETLFNNTKYILLTSKYQHSSLVYDLLQYTNYSSVSSRVHLITTAQEMHNKICDNIKKYAMFEIEDRFRALNKYDCPLLSAGDYNETWITFALKKHFPYKRTINTAIIKFNEVGLINFLKNRWLNINLKIVKENKFKMIDFHQVFFIFLILCCGILISLMILVLEIIVHYHETKNVSRKRK